MQEHVTLSLLALINRSKKNVSISAKARQAVNKYIYIYNVQNYITAANKHDTSRNLFSDTL